jgi:hypothetical protein
MPFDAAKRNQANQAGGDLSGVQGLDGENRNRGNPASQIEIIDTAQRNQVVSSSVAIDPLLQSLVGYWKMDEVSGTRVDSHTNGNDLTDNNTVTSSAGKIGLAATFTPANSESLSRADNTSLRGSTTEMSAACWITPNDINGALYFTIIGKNTSGAAYSWRFAHAGPLLQVDITSADGVSGSSAFTFSQLSAGVRAHVAFSYNAGVCVFYKNGAAVSNQGNNLFTTILQNTGLFQVGRYVAADTAFFNGDIDELGYWSRALTAAEVLRLYNSNAGLTYPFTS